MLAAIVHEGRSSTHSARVAPANLAQLPASVMFGLASMFALTFFGHQGWLVSTEHARVLIDPLLTPGFGHGGLLGQVYPPRLFDFEAFPQVDAVMLTHEHDDHFDVPSLARIDRRVPIYLSSRSSIAARELLYDMGFATVHALEPDASVTIGDLRYHTFVGDHRGNAPTDEWDALPFLVHDLDGHGSLFSSVDVRPRARDLARLRQLCARPGIWAYANNCSFAGFQTIHTSPPARAPIGDDSPALAHSVLVRQDAVAQAWGPPVANLICGGGWTLTAERSRLNHHLFPADTQPLLAALASARPGLPVLAPRPGQTLCMREGELVDTLPAQAFLSTPDPQIWPSREYRGPGPTLRDYKPASERLSLSARARTELLTALEDFARYLYGRPLFRALHSLPPQLPSGHRSALCLVLLDEGGDLVLRYAPEHCAFVPAPGLDAISNFASGLECWASDLHGLLQGSLGASALCYAGRLRTWNHAPSRLRASPSLLWHYASPLRRPDRARRLYAQLLADEAHAPVCVPARCEAPPRC